MACKEKECAQCGLIFVPNQGGKKYCCEHCKHEAEKARYRERNTTAGGPRKANGRKAKKVSKSVLGKQEEEELRDLFYERQAMTMPERYPAPRCQLEQDSIDVMRTGAKSYGYYKAGAY